jgi:cysteine sulfinate desulfinase/cysteine desulfurase-like protein
MGMTPPGPGPLTVVLRHDAMLRFSLGWTTTADDVAAAAAILPRVVAGARPAPARA